MFTIQTKAMGSTTVMSILIPNFLYILLWVNLNYKHLKVILKVTGLYTMR